MKLRTVHYSSPVNNHFNAQRVCNFAMYKGVHFYNVTVLYIFIMHKGCALRCTRVVHWQCNSVVHFHNAQGVCNFAMYKGCALFNNQFFCRGQTITNVNICRKILLILPREKNASKMSLQRKRMKYFCKKYQA